MLRVSLMAEVRYVRSPHVEYESEDTRNTWAKFMYENDARFARE